MRVLIAPLPHFPGLLSTHGIIGLISHPLRGRGTGWDWDWGPVSGRTNAFSPARLDAICGRLCEPFEQARTG